MPWTSPRDVLPIEGAFAHLDRLRAFGPSVLEDDDGGLRMWYSGHDGSTGRIVHAVRPPERAWERLGVSIGAGRAGASDAYGVESPSVVRTPGGYLMAYAGSDGADTRLHMATSADGYSWDAHGPCLQRGEPDAVGATHPCLVVAGERWWLFYSGYDGSGNGVRSAILAAVSESGASWDRVGPVLEPDESEDAVSEPSVVATRGRFSMLYVSHAGEQTTIDIATSRDGVSWDRRGTIVGSGNAEVDHHNPRSPCAARLHDRRLRLWYAARGKDDVEDGCRLWSIDHSQTTDDH
jgi:predicted GH43/DUF377 family glycosyl hydrolase